MMFKEVQTLTLYSYWSMLNTEPKGGGGVVLFFVVLGTELRREYSSGILV